MVDYKWVQPWQKLSQLLQLRQLLTDNWPYSTLHPKCILRNRLFQLDRWPCPCLFPSSPFYISLFGDDEKMAVAIGAMVPPWGNLPSRSQKKGRGKRENKEADMLFSGFSVVLLTLSIVMDKWNWHVIHQKQKLKAGKHSVYCIVFLLEYCFPLP